MAEIGRISLIIAFALAAYLTAASVLGVVWRQADLLASARRAVYAVTALVTLAWGTLLYSLVVHDFSIDYVARYNSRDTDLAFSLSGSYAGQEGSLLMWAWGVVAVMLAVTLQNRGRHRSLMPWATAVMGFVATFFLSMLVFLSDPFTPSGVPILEGRGLNPLLQNEGMLFHPPAIYLGYVAFTVPFAFALAALITGRLGDEWIRITRGWTLLAWIALGMGNLLGAQWAYVVLGWGGYWAWDPVENSSLMPWLTATAFLHSASIQHRRGLLKVWSLALIIATFALTIFGTFLTRSSVLASVHTFGDTSVGPLFLGMTLLTIALSTALIWRRWHLLRGKSEMDSLVSRESAFLLNNLLLVGATFAILWGTMFPVISEIARGIKITFSAPFFNQVVGPILLAVVALMGLCPLLGWRRASPDKLIRSLRFPAAAALATGIGGFLLGAHQTYAVVSLAVCGLAMGTVVQEFFHGALARAQGLHRSPFLALGPLVWGNRPRYGGYLVHLGVVLLAIGVIYSQGFQMEQNVVLLPGEEATIGSYRLVYNGLSDSRAGRVETIEADVGVYSGDGFLGTLRPSKEFYWGFESPNTEVAIRSTPFEDLYLILKSWDAQDRAGFRLVINPMVTWIWAGGYLILLGALIAFWPGIRREEI